jgi:hypothetical protein
MNTASISYNSTYGNGFPPSLAAIGNMVTAVPVTVGTTGQRKSGRGRRVLS